MTDIDISPNFTGYENAKYSFTIYPTKRIASADTIEIKLAPQISMKNGNPSCAIVNSNFVLKFLILK